MWMKDIKCKYMFIFPLQNLACKELTNYDQEEQKGGDPGFLQVSDSYNHGLNFECNEAQAFRI